jgi:uncharacterized membrane protein YphA (DoxX/SURF4 family)
MVTLDPTSTSRTTPSATQRRIVWGVRIALALAFCAAGLAKLAGMPQMVQTIEAIGFGQWFRYLTGATEVVSAVMLLLPYAGFLGGLLMTATMACAAVTHLALIGGSPIPALVLGLLSAFVTWRLRPASLRAVAV